MIGTRRVGEPAEHRGQQLPLDLRLPGDTLAERADVPQRSIRIGEPERLQPVEGGVRGQPQFP